MYSTKNRCREGYTHQMIFFFGIVSVLKKPSKFKSKFEHYQLTKCVVIVNDD